VADDAAAGGVGKVAVCPPEEGLDPAHELAQPERLREVVVGAQLEADHLVDLVVAGGEDEDGRLRSGRPQAPQDLESVHPGQPDVEDDEVGSLVRRELEALFAGSRDRNLVALLLECVLDAPGDGELVLDDENRCRHGADPTPDPVRGPARGFWAARTLW
jgi:hypothetical protein